MLPSGQVCALPLMWELMSPKLHLRPDSFVCAGAGDWHSERCAGAAGGRVVDLIKR